MKSIEPRAENLVVLMYGFLLPAVGGTIFWYLIQHIGDGHVLRTVTCAVAVYYFCLHFLAGQQLNHEHYGRIGFLLDMVVVVAVEALFYSIDKLPQHFEVGMASIVVILLMLLVWSVRTSRRHGLRGTRNHVALLVALVMGIVLWAASYGVEVLTPHGATLLSVSLLAVAATVYLALSIAKREAPAPQEYIRVGHAREK